MKMPFSILGMFFNFLFFSQEKNYVQDKNYASFLTFISLSDLGPIT